MAQFLGTVRGNRGEASRLGSKDSGVRVSACSWQGRIDVSMQSSVEGDRYWVSMQRHGSSQGWSGTIAEGFIGHEPDNLVGILPTPTIESFTDEAIAAEVKRRFGFELMLRKAEPA